MKPRSKSRARAEAIEPPAVETPAVETPAPAIGTALVLDVATPEESSANAEAAAAAVDAAPSVNGEPSPIAPGAPIADAPRGIPEPERWSKAKVKRSSRKELIGRVIELQERIPAAGETGAVIQATDAATLAADNLPAAKATLAMVVPVVSELVATLRDPSYRLAEAEQSMLIDGCSPALALHMATVGRGSPYALAVLTLAAVYAPRIMRDVAATRARSAAGAIEPASGVDAPAPHA